MIDYQKLQVFNKLRKIEIKGHEFYKTRSTVSSSHDASKMPRGVEFDQDVLDDTLLMARLKKLDNYGANPQLIKDLSSQALEIFNTKYGHTQNRVIIAVFGALVFGLLSFLFMFRLYPFIIAIVLGTVIGFYLGGKVKRRLKANDLVENRQIFIGYMHAIQEATLYLLEAYEYDVNSSRQITEHLLQNSYLLLLLKDGPLYGQTYQHVCENLRLILNRPQCHQSLKLSFEIFCKSIKSSEAVAKNYTSENEICRKFEMVFIAYLKAVMPFTSQIKLAGQISDFQRENIILGLQKDQRKRFKITDESILSEKVFFDKTLAGIILMVQMEPEGKNSFLDSLKQKERKLSLNAYKASYESFNKSELEEKINIEAQQKKARLAVVGNDESRKTFKHTFLPQSPQLDSVVIDPSQIQIEDGQEVALDVENNSERVSMIERIKPKEIDPNLMKLLAIDRESVENDWKRVHNSEFITVYKKNTGDSPVVLLKAYSYMRDVPADVTIEFIHDLKLRAQWDNVLHNMKSFDHRGPNVDVMYSLFKAPFGMSNRDFVQLRTRGKDIDDAEHIIHMVSIDHPDAPKIKGVVRAHTYISGYVVRTWRDDKGQAIGSVMTVVTQTDIGGLIPKWIVNTAAASAPAKWCKKFKEKALKYMKDGKL